MFGCAISVSVFSRIASLPSTRSLLHTLRYNWETAMIKGATEAIRWLSIPSPADEGELIRRFLHTGVGNGQDHGTARISLAWRTIHFDTETLGILWFRTRLTAPDFPRIKSNFLCPCISNNDHRESHIRSPLLYYRSYNAFNPEPTTLANMDPIANLIYLSELTYLSMASPLTHSPASAR